MSTVRITNIHPTATREDLAALLESHHLQSKVYFVKSSDGKQTATATLANWEDTQKLCKLPDHSIMLNDEVLTLDKSFLRFTTLYEAANVNVEYVYNLPF
jgi:hypothetical protein